MISERVKSYVRGAGLVLLVAVVIAAIFWDPNKRQWPNDGKTHIRYWYIVAAEDQVPYTVRRFNAAQDSVVVHATPIPWQEHEKKILTAVLSGDPPDVVSQFVPVVRWASRMALRPIDDLIQETGFDMNVFFPALVSEVKWMGRTFALPANTASYAFFYNKKLLAEAGLNPDRPPQTWNEVREYSKAITRYDDQGRMIVAGFLPPFSGAHTGVLGNLSIAALQAWELGAKFVSDDGKTVDMDSPEVLRAVQWTKDYYRDYDFQAVQAFIGGLGTGEQQGFLTGKIAMMVLDMSFLDLIQRYRPDMDYGVVATPSFEGYPTASMAGSWWLGIPRGAAHPRAAWDYMRFATRADIQLEELAARDDDLFPANRLAATDSSFLVSPEMEVFVHQMEYAHSPTVVPLAHGVFWREFYLALERTVYGRQPADVAFAQAEAQVQESLDRSSEYDEYVRAHMDFTDE